jgi:hypothetical protein
MPTVLTIPSSDVYTIRGIDNKLFFKRRLTGKNSGAIMRDIHVNIENNSKRALEVLAKEMGVLNISKLKKAELEKIVSENIRFD